MTSLQILPWKLFPVRPILNDGDQSLGSISGMNEDSTRNVWIASYDAGLTQVPSPREDCAAGMRQTDSAYKGRPLHLRGSGEEPWIGKFSGGGLSDFVRAGSKPSIHAGDEAQGGYSCMDSPDGSVWATTFGQRIVPLASGTRLPPDAFLRAKLARTTISPTCFFVTGSTHLGQHFL